MPRPPLAHIRAARENKLAALAAVVTPVASTTPAASKPAAKRKAKKRRAKRPAAAPITPPAVADAPAETLPV